MDRDEYKKGVEATFNDVSHRYDENRFFAISAAKMAELVPPAESLSILDLSTGTGAVALEVVDKHPSAHIHAIDLSQGMLEIAISKAREKGISNIEFIQCDVDSIAYDKHTFDIVTCGYGLFFYPDMEATYQAICKTIKPGGRFLFSSFTEQAFNPHAELFLRRLEHGYSVEPPSRLRERLKTKQQIEALVAGSEFRAVDVIHEPIRYPISINDWWALLNSAGFKSLLDKLDKKSLERFKQEHLAEIQALSDDPGLELNADTLYAVVTF
ncbi:class I SAM-dependent methyltransferase [Candidatus Thiodiazotropha sp. CDECU1]|uniref:class I SAM-dependent methyltransferase n=1 Tax=Candidatus Thiodiazotropha sp. CDECU1 TaxID=3065865 RepID=UPI00292CB13A|nr:class I SAM-dependent methyltransferase [Candidatus Thiodiazotropha sp. CDECU1]